MEQLEYNDYYVPIALDDLVSTAKDYKEKGYRLAQMHPVLQRDDSITLYYSFVKDNDVVNLRIDNIVKDRTEVPSLTNLFIAIFVFENEAHDLFGVNIVGNLLDFHGKFYDFGEGVEAPMTIISPEQLAAREKAAKIEKAKAAKAAKAKREAAAKAAATEAARQEVVENLAAAEAAGEVSAPKTTAGASIPAPTPKADPRYAGFDPETDMKQSKAVREAQKRKLEEQKEQDSEGVSAQESESSASVSADADTKQSREQTDAPEQEGE